MILNKILTKSDQIVTMYGKKSLHACQKIQECHVLELEKNTNVENHTGFEGIFRYWGIWVYIYGGCIGFFGGKYIIN